MAETTGHFGNTTPFETMQPKGSVGRISTTVVNQATGDAVAGRPGVALALQRGVPEEREDAAAHALPATVIHNDVSIISSSEATVTLTMPTLGAVQALFPDLKYGDRLRFTVYVSAAASHAAVITCAAGAGNLGAFGAPFNIVAASTGDPAIGEQHALLVEGRYLRQNPSTPYILWMGWWTNQRYTAPA